MELRAEHDTPFRRAGTYAPFPVLDRLAEGGWRSASRRTTRTSRTTASCTTGTCSPPPTTAPRGPPSDDPAVPFNWPGTGPRERWDRYAAALPDGSYLAAGAIGWTTWEAGRRAEAEAAGLQINPHPGGDGRALVVAPSRVFVQRSRDGGATWERREWPVPGGYRLTGFPRAAVLHDGTVLVPLYDIYPEGQKHRDRNLLLRLADGGDTCAPDADGRRLRRGLGRRGGAGGDRARSGAGAAPPEPAGVPLDARGSDDGGRTWSQPLRTEIWGYPPHLLRLRDGRVLCTYGHRRDPLGVQAVISADGGRSWDVPHRAVLRDDGETRRRGDRESRDLGYPVSVRARRRQDPHGLLPHQGQRDPRRHDALGAAVVSGARPQNGSAHGDPGRRGHDGTTTPGGGGTADAGSGCGTVASSSGGSRS